MKSQFFPGRLQILISTIFTLTIFGQVACQFETGALSVDSVGGDVAGPLIPVIVSRSVPEEAPAPNFRYLCLESAEELNRTVRHLGVKCNCPSIYAPVCGSDNITYHNRCFMHCRATQSEHKYHRYQIKLRVKNFGECRTRHGRHNIRQGI